MKYFLYSDMQLKEKNSILKKNGYMFVPGTVVVNGRREMYTQLSDTATLDRFIDSKVVHQTENLSDVTYIAPSKVLDTYYH